MHRRLLPATLILAVFLAGCQLQLPLGTPSSQNQSNKTWKQSGNVYTTIVRYDSPAGLEVNTITVSLDGDVISSVDMAIETQIDASIRYQERFAKEVSGLIVGKKLADIKPLDKISGASLTTNAFNQAIADLQLEQS